GVVFGAEAAEGLDAWGRRLGRALEAGDVEVHTWTLAQMGRATSRRVAAEAWVALQGFADEVLAWWADHDLLLTPTIAEPPPPLGEFASTGEDPLAAGLRAGRLTPFTTPFNVTGQPAISVPAAWNDDGLPIGVQLVAAPGREDVLIRVAAQLEAAIGWTGRRPIAD
ncbi:MAG: amidase family protein, partial [Actinomycetota bacterium]